MGSKNIWPLIRNEILFHPDRFFNDHVRINDCAGSLCVGIASSGNNKATARVQYIPRCQGDFGTRGHQRSRKRMRVSILILFIPPGVFWAPATPKKLLPCQVIYLICSLWAEIVAGRFIWPTYIRHLSCRRDAPIQLMMWMTPEFDYGSVYIHIHTDTVRNGICLMGQSVARIIDEHVAICLRLALRFSFWCVVCLHCLFVWLGQFTCESFRPSTSWNSAIRESIIYAATLLDIHETVCSSGGI